MGVIGSRSWARTILQCLFHNATAHRLELQQLLGQRLQGRVMLLQQFLGTLVLFGHETLDFSVDHLTSLWTDLAVVLDRSAQVLELLTCVSHRAKLVAHSKFGDHTAGPLSAPPNSVTHPRADNSDP